MSLNNHITKLLLSFIAGIIVADLVSVHWVVLFTIWSTSIFILLIAVHFGNKLLTLRKWISTLLLIVFFLSGGFSFQYQLPVSQKRHFNKHYLVGSSLLIDVYEVDQDTTGFRKMIVNVEGVLKRRKIHPTVGKLLCYIKLEERLTPGDKLMIKPRISEIENKGNPGEFDAEKYWKYQGIDGICFLKNDQVRIISKGGGFVSFWESTRRYFKRILEEHLSENNADIATALALGDKSGLSNDYRNAYANAGAMHILAVSGMHVGILLGFLQWMFYRIPFFRKRNFYIIISLILVWSFAFMTGLSSSVFRATLMFSILALGQLRGYSFFSINALFVSGLIILFVDPLSLFHVGFQLSFLAMLGISLFFGPIRSIINSRWKWLNYLWDGTALGIAAQIGTIPVSLFYFHQFPNYFILTNLGLLILAGATLVSVFILFLTYWIPYLGSFVAYIVDFIFTILNNFISFINDLPGTISTGYDPSAIWVIFMYVATLFTITSWSSGYRRRFFSGLTMIFILGLFLIVKRELNRSSDEIVFLNNEEKVVLIKEKQKVICLYPKDHLELRDAKYLVNPYAKLKGAKIEYVDYLSNSRIRISSQIEVLNKRNTMLIDYVGNTICFTDEKGLKECENVDIIIHNRLPSTSTQHATTENGAVLWKPNGRLY